MNYRIMEENLKHCERVEKDSPLEACVTALGMASLVIQQTMSLLPDKKPEEITEKEMALLRQAYGVAAGGITSNLKKITDAVGILYQPDMRMPDMKKMFEDSMAQLQEKDAACKEEAELNSELIKTAEELEERLAKLKQIETWKKDGLKIIEDDIGRQEKANDALGRCIQDKDRELQNLKTKFEECRKELGRYEAALGENSTLLENLPEKYGITEIDEALVVAAEAGQSANEIIEKGNEVLSAVIHAVAAFYNGEKI